MSNPNAPIHIFEAQDLARATGREPSEILAEDKLRRNGPAKLRKELAADEQRLVEATQRLQEKRDKTIALAERWNSLLDRYERLQKGLSYSAGQADGIRQALDSDRAHFFVSLGHGDGPFSGTHALVGHGYSSVGVREALALIKEWQGEKILERDKVGEELRAFAALHGIESNLPNELKIVNELPPG